MPEKRWAGEGIWKRPASPKAMSAEESGIHKCKSPGRGRRTTGRGVEEKPDATDRSAGSQRRGEAAPPKRKKQDKKSEKKRAGTYKAPSPRSEAAAGRRAEPKRGEEPGRAGAGGTAVNTTTNAGGTLPPSVSEGGEGDRSVSGGRNGETPTPEA